MTLCACKGIHVNIIGVPTGLSHVVPPLVWGLSVHLLPSPPSTWTKQLRLSKNDCRSRSDKMPKSGKFNDKKQLSWSLSRSWSHDSYQIPHVFFCTSPCFSCEKDRCFVQARVSHVQRKTRCLGNARKFLKTSTLSTLRYLWDDRCCFPIKQPHCLRGMVDGVSRKRWDSILQLTIRDGVSHYLHFQYHPICEAVVEHPCRIIGSMGLVIFTYISPKCMVNVGKI